MVQRRNNKRRPCRTCRGTAASISLGFHGASSHDCGVRALRWFAVVAWFGGLGGAGCSREPAKVAADASAKADGDAGVSAAPRAGADASASAIAATARRRAGAATPKRPTDLDVIVISVDSLRADMPWAGYPRDIAPGSPSSRSEA